MIATYATAALAIAASLTVGRALLAVLGVRTFTWVSGAAGFALLIVLAPLLIRLPARATTTAILLTLLLTAAAIKLAADAGLLPGRNARREPPPQRAGRAAGGSPRSRTVGPEVAGDPPVDRPDAMSSEAPPREPTRTRALVALAVVAIVIAAASLPFLFNERFGVLGEGIYTNDHAAQLYWADWLQHGVGEEPQAVRFGYPIGPQALAAVVAEATGASLVDAFNGLMLAIAALTGLTALAFCGGLPPGRRAVAASLTSLPYLGAAFLAQSAFKETVMALLLIAFAIGLRDLGREAVARRATVVTLGLLAVAAVLAYSVAGLAWFAAAIAVWLALELAAGRRPIAIAPLREAVGRHRVLTAAGALAVAVVAAVVAGQAVAFMERIADIFFSAGRLSSPVFPGEVFGVWPEGDYRIVRGDVDGAIPAALVGIAALAVGTWRLVRRGEVALLATLAAGAAVYLGARLFAEIHVQAKALAVMGPLVMLISLRALLMPPGPSEPRRLALSRLGFGAAFAVLAALSTVLALRAAPVGFDERAEGLERLGEQIEGSSVVFLGVDRFSAYRLRGTEVQSPGGFVPPRVNARSRKRWTQGRAMDFDTLSAARLDNFDYAITTAAAYQSTPPQSFSPVTASAGYVLWERTGTTPETRVLPGEGGDPGAILDCDAEPPEERFPPGTRATVIGEPVVGDHRDWQGDAPVDPASAAAGQEAARSAPAELHQELDLDEGRWLLSLQYHSQVPLTVEVAGSVVELPPSLEGMYLDGAGRGAFWPAGELELAEGLADRPVTVTVRAAEPSALQRLLGVERRVWLGDLGASPAVAAETVPVAEACDRYVDRLLVPETGTPGG